MKIGHRVRIKNNPMSRRWAIANEVGVITGPDPREFDKDVITVKLDSKQGICEGGIHIDNLEKI